MAKIILHLSLLLILLLFYDISIYLCVYYHKNNFFKDLKLLRLSFLYLEKKKKDFGKATRNSFSF